MRGQSQGYHRSVDRGTCRQGIELRNNRIRSADVVPRDGRPYGGGRYREPVADSAQSKTPSTESAGPQAAEPAEAPNNRARGTRSLLRRPTAGLFYALPPRLLRTQAGYALWINA